MWLFIQMECPSFTYSLSAAEQPKVRVWRRQSQGLTVTAKGSKDLAGGKRLHVLAAMSYGKGDVLRETYETMKGSFFATFVREKFPRCFVRAGRGKLRLFVMDNQPCQVSKAAKLAFKDIRAVFHQISPRSPCLNAIENILNIVRKMLEQETIRLQIEHEFLMISKAE